MPHRNAPLTVEGRRRLCERVDRGRARAHVAAEAGISRQCLSTWHRRWQVQGESGLVDRSSRPHRSPNRTPPAVEARIEQIRRDRKLGAERIAHELRRTDGTVISPSGVHRVLVRLGISRLRDLDPPTGHQLRHADPATAAAGPNRWRRYERARPGELVHIDVKKLGRIRDGGGGGPTAATAPNHGPPGPGHGWAVHGRTGMGSVTVRRRYQVGGLKF